ncbi:MAG: 2'-5' RNA ligase family protein [Leptolyngbyaceae bacterium]|nr:2'-5' RNA ligase family protein [Leptolyngbyaceae bacterium]
MNPSKRLFFLALLPPVEVQDYANQIKQEFAERYGSRGAQKSPPHVTLQPPFQGVEETVPDLKQHLRNFVRTQTPIPMTLSGFGAFPPRVIYINVLKTPELLQAQTDLSTSLATTLGIVDPTSQQRPFSPHMTVAFRDLTKQNFKAAWPEFQGRSLYFEFTVSCLTLLHHTGERWLVEEEFPFGD